MTIRVIQWGAGKNGCALIRAIADHQSLELVGCRVYSDSKHGRDAGKLAGIAPLGISATTDLQTASGHRFGRVASTGSLRISDNQFRRFDIS